MKSVVQLFTCGESRRSLYDNLKHLGCVSEFIIKFSFHQSSRSVADILKLRLKHMREELDELEQAIDAADEYAVWDALVDLIYLAVGTVFLIQMPFSVCFDRVHRANMNKVRCVSPEQSKRGELPDCYKGDDWEEPSFEDLEKVGIFDLQSSEKG